MAVSFEMRLGIVAEDDCRQPKCCGAFCKTHTPQNLKLTYLAIEKALGKIATSNGSHSPRRRAVLLPQGAEVLDREHPAAFQRLVPQGAHLRHPR